MIRNLICLILILASQAALAWPPTYGAEFVLTNQKLQTANYNFFEQDPNKSPEKAAQLELVNHIKQKCDSTKCEVIEADGKFGSDYIVEFEDGFWIRYSFDPKVIEIMFKPSTIAEMRHQQARLDEYIFEAGKELGLSAPKDMGGHVNMGVTSMFGNDVESFLKFFVDYANHPDLTLGTLGRNLPNAPTLSSLKNEQRQALKRLVADFYAGKVKRLNQAAFRIQDEVYTTTFFPEWGGYDHYQAVGLKYVNKTDLQEKDAPIELRGIRAQRNTEDFIKMALLMEKRVQYLNKNVSQIIYNESKKMNFTPAQLKTRFKMYVEETGLNYSDYEDLLPENILTANISPIADEKAPAEDKLMDLIDYFDLLSSSTYVKKQFIEVLSNPDLQEDPRVKAFQRYFERMSKPNTASVESKNWFTKTLIFLGLSPSESAKLAHERNRQAFFKELHDSIEHQKSPLKTSNILKKPAPPKAFSCKGLFNF